MIILLPFIYLFRQKVENNNNPHGNVCPETYMNMCVYLDNTKTENDTSLQPFSVSYSKP